MMTVGGLLVFLETRYNKILAIIHVLMGTDAPESRGFKVNLGNNVYINLEPDTKEETKKLFDALSAGGTVTMEL